MFSDIEKTRVILQKLLSQQQQQQGMAPCSNSGSSSQVCTRYLVERLMDTEQFVIHLETENAKMQKKLDEINESNDQLRTKIREQQQELEDIFIEHGAIPALGREGILELKKALEIESDEDDEDDEDDDDVHDHRSNRAQRQFAKLAAYKNQLHEQTTIAAEVVKIMSQ